MSDEAKRIQSMAARLTDHIPERVKDVIPAHGEKLEPRPSLLESTQPKELRDDEAPGFAVALASSQLLAADFIASSEDDADRRAKMDRVIERQRETITELTGSADPVDPVTALAAFGAQSNPSDRLGFLIELYFMDPFSPYSLRFSSRVRKEGLRRLTGLVGEQKKTMGRIRRAGTEAKRSHSKRSWGKVGLVGVGGAVLLGLGGFAAAPLLGAALGAGAGLSGAAATSFGLALLGGGALATGGAGMAGGLWLIAGAGAAGGLLAGGGGVGLYQLGAAQARGELVKLQVTFKLTMLHGQADLVKAQQAILGLAAQAEDLRTRMEEERLLNEANARRVTDLEETLVAVEEAIAWMETEKEAVA